MVKRVIITLLLILIGVLALTGSIENTFIGKTALHRIDTNAQAYYDKTFKHALYTYGIVRGINAVISVIQGSDIALAPAGLGINLAVGEILDPLNDLIERFSWICLAATTSLGIQKILMTISAWLGFTLLLSISMLVLAVSTWFSNFKNIDLRHLGLQLIIVSIVLRYGLPFTAYATSKIDTLFFEKTVQEASATLEQANSAIQDDNEGLVESDDGSLLQKFKKLFKNVDRAVQLEARVRKIKASISGYTSHIIDLITIFILQTLLVPLAMLYLILRLVGWVLKLDLVKILNFNKMFVRRGRVKVRRMK